MCKIFQFIFRNHYRNLSLKAARLAGAVLFLIAIPGGALLAQGAGVSGSGNFNRDTALYDSYDSDQRSVPIDLIFYEHPFNSLDGGAFPSMSQALLVSKSMNYSVRYIIGTYLAPQKPGPLNEFSSLAFDFFSVWIPGGPAWLHEEWHRSVLTKHGISSFNEVNEFPLFAEYMKVKHVADADLIRLKKESPADMVRLSAAGMEADLELVSAMAKDRFFHQTSIYSSSTFIMIFNVINVAAYRHSCTISSTDDTVKNMIREEGTNISERDFTGMDCNAWVYDLFRPNEPYEARGIHASGTGIDRYILRSDLTDEEKTVLKNQFYFSLLNLVNPMMWGKHRFQPEQYVFGEPFYWNFAFTHHLTSFGYDLSTDFYVKSGEKQFVISYHNYVSQNLYMPGLDIELYRYPIYTGMRRFFVSLKAAFWLQPADLLYAATSSEPGAMLQGDLRIPAGDTIELYTRAQYKTNGWVAGTVWQEEEASLFAGLTWYLPE